MGLQMLHLLVALSVLLGADTASKLLRVTSNSTDSTVAATIGDYHADGDAFGFPRYRLDSAVATRILYRSAKLGAWAITGSETSVVKHEAPIIVSITTAGSPQGLAFKYFSDGKWLLDESFAVIEVNNRLLSKNNSCRCYACDLGKRPTSGNLTVEVRNDGSGAVAQQILFALAWANQLQLKFRGIHVPAVVKAHNVDREKMLEFLFGEDLIISSKSPKGQTDGWINLNDFSFRHPRFPFLFTVDVKDYVTANPASKTMNEEGFATLFAANYHGLVSYVMGGPLRTPSMPLLNVNLAQDPAPAAPEYSHPIFFTDTFLAALQRGAKCNIDLALGKKSYFQRYGSTGKQIIRVCAHVRHGDLDDTRIKPTIRLPRMTSDAAYFVLFDAISDTIKRIMPDATVDMHAFTSCSNAFNDSSCAEYEASLRAKYRAHNVFLHMDFESNTTAATSDAMTAWAHFIKADILITSKSTFSMVPAFFNRQCVIYQPHWNAPLPHWVSVHLWPSQEALNASAISDELAFAFPRCLSRF